MMLCAMAELKRILLVDDDEDLRGVAQLALEALGELQVKGCASAEEALEAVATFQPDLVLLDMQMPGMDGITALRRLQEHPVAPPVVFLTASQERPQRLQQLGALDVIAKPFDPMELFRAVQAIWKRGPGSC